MELNSQINTFSRGMNMDADVSVMPEGQYRYAENVRIITNDNGSTGVLQNIEHIKQYVGIIPKDETILGTATTRLYDEETNGTIECGIVFTKKTVNNKPYNTLYKVLGFDSSELQIIPIVKGYLQIENNVSIITNYESDKISNVYITDGLTPIKIINICDTFDEINDPTRFDITPGCVLLPFIFQNTIGGSLPAGAIQYCYQLFNERGPETTTSALSEVIPITKYDNAGESAKVKGQLKGELSNKGCQISAKFKNDGRFDRARIFSIIYLDNISIPDIYIVNEIEIPVTDKDFIEFSYNDTGSSFLSKITIDEFNALVPFEFNAKCIEKMGNRLYAANIQELTWDIEYDARAYRADKSRTVVLEHSDTSKTISGSFDSILNNVPKEHDCINPSNTDVLSPTVYAYNANGKLGGTGLNVSYEFVYTELTLSDKQGYGISYDVELNTTKPVSTIYTLDQSGTSVKATAIPNGKRCLPNYSDPFICSNFLGYKRDEIYRFGIIFYNDKNIPSPVHWIGDIRMPSIKDEEGMISKIKPFATGEYSHSHNSFVEQVAYALGIKFNVTNIPAEVKSYEIVRCDRNELDRTIITQGIMGALFKFDTWGENTQNFGTNDVRPTPMFNLASNFRTKYRYKTGEDDYDDTHTVEPGYFEFVSPEVCIGKDTILESIKNNIVCPLYKVDSVYSDRVSISQSSIYTVSDTGDKTTVENDDMFGVLAEHDGKKWIDMGHGYKNKKYGYAGVFKYYNMTADSSIQQNIQVQDGIVSNILPYFVNLEDAKGYVQFIGAKAYVNMSTGGYDQVSAHGTSAVLSLPESFNPYVEPTTIKDFCTALITDIKQTVIPYGGNTYISRQNSVYGSCGCFSQSGSTSVICYGGDTYLGIFDYLNTSVIQTKKDADQATETRVCCVNYIPLETVVNLNMRSDDSYHRSASGRMGPNLIQNEPGTLSNGYTQKKPYYEYNPVYSATSGSKHYVPKGIYSIDKMLNQHRIVVSELKTNNEMVDSWCKFKFANYLDVDGQYGQITNIKNINNKLYYWQDSAVGVASVNERSLITDNNMAELTLGTGGILARFDYITVLNGSNTVNDKSIVQSPNSVYWYDFDKNELCALSNGIIPISKISGVQSYLNSLSKESKKNAVSFYDKKYNEVWFKLANESLIYNEQAKAFTSIYTHNPNWFFPFSDKLITIKDDNSFYRHNTYCIEKDLSESKENRISKIQFVVNKDFSNTKVFDNVQFNADLIDDNNQTPHVITDVQFKTKTQYTKLDSYDGKQKSPYELIEAREDNYRFAIPREKTISDVSTKANQSYLGRMRGKYLICDYTFDCNNNREFKLPYVKTTYRYSML